MRRIPIRIRLGLAFAGAMAVVLALGGVLLYARIGRRARSDDHRIAPLAADQRHRPDQAGGHWPGAGRACRRRPRHVRAGAQPRRDGLRRHAQLNHQPALTARSFGGRARVAAGRLLDPRAGRGSAPARRAGQCSGHAARCRRRTPLSDRDQALASLRREVLWAARSRWRSWRSRATSSLARRCGRSTGCAPRRRAPRRRTSAVAYPSPRRTTRSAGSA